MNNTSLLLRILGYARSRLLTLSLIFILFPIAAIFWHIYSPAIYAVKSIIEFQPNKQESFVSNRIGLSGQKDINDQLIIYKSRSNLNELVEDLNLNIEINSPNNDHNIHEDYFFDIDFINLDDDADVLFFDVGLTKQGYVIYGLSKIEETLRAYNETYTEDEAKFSIIRKSNIDYANERLSIKLLDKKLVTDSLERTIRVDLLDSGDYYSRGSLFSVQINSSNPDLALKQISRLNEIYLNNSITRNSKKANASVDFLEARILEAQINLDQLQVELTDFQKTTSFYDNEEEVRTKILELTKIEEKINEFRLQEIDLRARFNNTNPAYINLVDQLDLLANQKNEIELEISSLPDIERKYADLLRDIQINQEVLATLQNRKIEFSIIEVSTLSDAEIIDDPYVAEITSSGLFEKIILAFVMGGALVFSIATYYVYFINMVQNPNDALSAGNFKLLDVINQSEDDLITLENEKFDDLAVNLSLLLSNKKVIFVGGALKGAGKTTMSSLISEILAKKGKKVLLIDTDYRRGDLHQMYGMKRPNMSDLADENYDFSNCKTKRENLWLFPRPNKSSDAQVIAGFNEKFSLFLSRCKSNFDYVVIDSAPLLALQQALIPYSLADLHIFVIEHKKTRVQEIETLDKIISSFGKENNYLIYNKFVNNAGTYGYYDYYNYKYSTKEYGYQSSD